MKAVKLKKLKLNENKENGYSERNLREKLATLENQWQYLQLMKAMKKAV